MGADGMFSPDVVEGAGDAVEGLFVSSPDLTAFSAEYETEFLPKYQELFGSVPISIFHAHAFDAAMLVFQAIEKVAVQEEDGTLHIPRQALREAVAATANYQGLVGTLTCNEHLEASGTVIKEPGDCGASALGVWQYTFGDYEIFTNPKVFWAPSE
jgi:branched-chain amino acid transport system substrate-binding protein